MRKQLLVVCVTIVTTLTLIVTASQALAAPLHQAKPDQPPVAHFPIWEEWASSAHAHADAASFTHWNEETPPRVPETCAKCHSSSGFQDALGVDGSKPGQVDASHPTGTVINCETCHNDATVHKTSVVMPSGIELTEVGTSSICLECHQGLASQVDIEEAIKAAGIDADVVSKELDITAYHFDAGAALNYGTLAKGGYEYDGYNYDVMYTHVEGYESCTDCHDPHSLQIDLETCATCHQGVASVDDLRNIRMHGSLLDYNGNGDVTEGIYDELTGLQDILLANIQTYAREIANTEIAYSAETYPYFFTDTNKNGQADASEVTPGNRFAAWTPRLLRAAYNYRATQADAGAYIHASQYVIQLLYDSLTSLNEALHTPTDMTTLERISPGHFSGSNRAFRYWDAKGVVPGTCARCHTDSGLPVYLKETVNVLTEPSNRLQCTTCHDGLAKSTLRGTGPVRFPNGAIIDSGDPGVNLCLNCHQGRESTISLNRMMGDATPDQQAPGLRFPDIHYFAASATRWGAEAQGAYEYTNKEYGDKEYAGFFVHGFGQLNLCKDCHDVHALDVKANLCVACHPESTDNDGLRDIRMDHIDYDGDGDDAEGIYYEIETLQAQLYAAIQAYAKSVTDKSLVYVPTGYPYFFVIDRNNNGAPDREEIKADNAFTTWTPRLLRAAYNYQNSRADPGAFAHNGRYIIQTLYDSIEDLGVDVSALIRP